MNSRIVLPFEIRAMNMPTNGAQDNHQAQNSMVQLKNHGRVSGVQIDVQKLCPKICDRQYPKFSTIVFNRSNVGPAQSTKSIKTNATDILISLSSLTPLSIPVTADRTAMDIMMIMMTVCAEKSLVEMISIYRNPAPSWAAPNPKVVTIPNKVTQSAMISIMCPRGPLILSFHSGQKHERSDNGNLQRKPKYANAKAIIPYTVHALMPQWKMERNNASLALGTPSTKPTAE